MIVVWKLLEEDQVMLLLLSHAYLIAFPTKKLFNLLDHFMDCLQSLFKVLYAPMCCCARNAAPLEWLIVFHSVTVSVHISKVNQLLQKEINLLPAFIYLSPILGRRKEFQKSQGI